MAGYTLTQHSQGHVKDKNGQDIPDLCIWCYRITYDPGPGNPADRTKLSDDWRLEVPVDVLQPGNPPLNGANVDPKSVPSYSGGGKKPGGGKPVNVDYTNPDIQPPAGPQAPKTNQTWIDLCFVVNCGQVGTIMISVDRKKAADAGFKPVDLEHHTASNTNQEKVLGPK